MPSGISTIFLSENPDGLCDRLKLIYDFAKEMHFDTKAQGNKSTQKPLNLVI